MELSDDSDVELDLELTRSSDGDRDRTNGDLDFERQEASGICPLSADLDFVLDPVRDLVPRPFSHLRRSHLSDTSDGSDSCGSLLHWMLVVHLTLVDVRRSVQRLERAVYKNTTIIATVSHVRIFNFQ